MAKRRKEKSQRQVIYESTNKMQRFLEKKGLASSRTELERKTTIEIIGTSEDGRERLIIPELREKYGSDTIELDDSFQILMPFILKGTIIMNLNNETRYEEYEVYNITDTKFSLRINDYIMTGKMFALVMKIDVNSIARVAPIYTYSYECKNVNDFFIEPYKDMVDNCFTEYEKNAIVEPLMNDCNEHNINVTICNLIAIFRGMNFLKKKYATSNSLDNIYSNEYFRINNWDGKISESCFREVQNDQVEELLQTLMKSTDYTTIIPHNQTVFVLKELIKRENINTFLAAVGFVYKSGLKIIEDELEMISKRENSVIEMVIGSLQNFDHKNPGSKIDRVTVEMINKMIERMDIKVYAYQPAFYHGKFYYLGSRNKGYVITGSSNISNTAFNENYELDIIHTFKPKLNNRFANWFFQLRNKSKEVKKLDTNKFMKNHWESEQDAFLYINKNNMTLDNLKSEIANLTDDDKKFRLNLWMEHMPTCVYKDIGIKALQNYILFVFAYKKLAVFESFIPGNAYYIFKYDELDTMIKNISRMTKSEMMSAEYSTKRGNHIKNRDSLKLKIDNYFEE